MIIGNPLHNSIQIVHQMRGCIRLVGSGVGWGGMAKMVVRMVLLVKLVVKMVTNQPSTSTVLEECPP